MYPEVRESIKKAQQEVEDIAKTIRGRKLSDAHRSDIRHALGFIENDIWRLKAAINELEASLDETRPLAN